MKKAWIFLIALALLAFSMPIFADSMAPAAGSFHAWNQGDFFPYFATGSNTASSGWGPTWDSVKGIDQEWTFSYDGNNYGFNATLEFGMDNFGNVTVGSLATGYNPSAALAQISWFGTYYKFGDIAKVTIGKPRFNDYTDFTAIEGQNFARFGDSDFTGILQLFPASGASIAAALYSPNTGIGAVGNSAAGVGADLGNNFGVAASYAVPNVAAVKVMYKAREQVLGDTGVQGPPVNSAFQRVVSGSVSYSGMKGSTAIVGAQADISDSNNTVITAFLTGSTTTMAPLTLAADLAIKNSASPSQTAYFVEVQGEYVVAAPWSFGVQVGYDGGSATGVKVGWYDGGAGEWTGFELWPYMKANFDNGSYFKVGFVYASADSTGASNAVIAVPIVYVWVF
jgi:hypothetical protein